MAGSKVMRLTKAAREFNIGRETIVEFLEKKGFEIDVNPNTKLSPEMVELLSDEFSAEKSVKEEARKKGLASTKRETISLEDRIKPAPDMDDADEEQDIIIRGVSVEIDEEFKRAVEPHEKKQPEQEVPAKPEVPAEPEKPAEEEKPAEPEAKAEPPAEEEKPPVEEKPAEKEEPKESAEESPVAETAVEEEEPVAESKPKPQVEEKATEAPVEPKPEPEPEPKREPEPEPKPEPEKEPAKAEKAEEPAKAEEETKPTPPKKEETPQTKEAEKTSASTEPRVLGKIDLASINERTKPPRKSAAEKRKEREEKKKAEATVRKGRKVTKQAEKPKEEPKKPVQEPKPAKQEKKAEDKKTVKTPDNFLKTEVQKLSGPNIIGKIELPAEKKPTKKKPVASSTDDKVSPKRKKRKRIRKDDKPAGQDNRNAQHKKEGEKARAKARPARGKKRRHEPKPELSEEDVQKQIKETLARLSGGGKSKGAKYRKAKRDLIHKQKEQEAAEKEEEKKTLTVAEFVTANELANMMDKPVTDIISVCMQLGLFVSINQRLDAETITLVAEEFGFGVNFESAESAIDQMEEEEDNPEDLEPRSPIVTVMGHVDHGKTKLLDYIRSANVVAGEAGGITQHIGAYEVILDSEKKITFLDTPGHEAFTAMRARGAKITDVAIIVVAADDSVMPQTVEAINHAQAANVPIVFAINKIDKPTANPDRIKDQLSQMNILVEDWGGKFQSQEISAKAGINIDELLEKVLLEAEMLDLKANPNRNAHGTVIESSLDKGRGYVSTMLVQNGTMKIGDLILAGSHFGRVKAMYNERNQPIKEAGPSAPVLMLGMNGAPQAGDLFKAMTDEREAKHIASKRQQLQREQGLRTQKHITLDEIGRRIAIGDFKELNIIVKGDVDGSVEALSDSLLKLSTEEVQVNVIHKSVGQVTETDVMLASASNAVVVAFQVRPSLGARRIAEKEQIDIRTYSIIYSAIEEIKAAIEGMLAPDIEEKITCNIEVRETFKISKVGTIAGCYVLDGTVNRNTRVRIIRDGIVMYSGKLGSLKRFKDDVKEVAAGYECGLNIENFNDIKVGDIVEGFEEIKVARKLD